MIDSQHTVISFKDVGDGRTELDVDVTIARRSAGARLRGPNGLAIADSVGRTPTEGGTR
jgi:hypothetical protein